MPTTNQRGYNYQHQKLRKQCEPQVKAGKATCWRCQQRIDPGTPWDLGHSDDDRTKYMGPEHRACNRATVGRGTAMFTGPPADTSRAW